MSYHTNRTGCLGVGYKSRWASSKDYKNQLTIKTGVRTMFSKTKAVEKLGKSMASINTNQNIPLIKVPKRNLFTGFFHEKENNEYIQKNNNNSDVSVYNIKEEEAEKKLKIKKITDPLKQDKKNFVKPWGNPHPQLVYEDDLGASQDKHNVEDIVIPAISVTHTVPSIKTQDKKDFRVLARVQLSDDPTGSKKDQFAILTNRTTNIPEMVKCGYSDRITQRFFTSNDKEQNNANKKGVKYLYEVYSAAKNYNQNQKKFESFMFTTLVNVGLDIHDVETILYKNQHLLETFLSKKKKPLLIAGNVKPVGVMPAEKKKTELEDSRLTFKKNNAQFTQKVQTPKKSNRNFHDAKPNVDTHLHRPRKKLYVKQKDGKFVKYKNNRYFREEHKSMSKKPTAQQVGNTNNNKENIINNDDDIFS